MPCELRYTVRVVSSAYPASIVGLQVVEHGPDARIVTVTGEVDALTAPELADFVTAQLAVSQLVVVNLDGVRLLASAGLSVLFEVNELAIHEDRDLRLVCHSRTVNLALEITGLRERLPFANSVPDALNTVH
jgi:anti-sigma B factor antagonist